MKKLLNSEGNWGRKLKDLQYTEAPNSWRYAKKKLKYLVRKKPLNPIGLRKKTKRDSIEFTCFKSSTLFCILISANSFSRSATVFFASRGLHYCLGHWSSCINEGSC